MQRVYGTFNPDGGDGYLRPVYFPSLTSMGVWTSDGRRLSADGGGIYGDSLPRDIKAQFQQPEFGGHAGSIIVGSLQEVTFHEDGNVSGKGWLADVPESHRLVTLLKTKSLFHNSIDMGDIEVDVSWESDDPEDPGFWNLQADFVKWNIAATTFVDVPAFANAHGTLDAPTEITASLEPLVFEFETTTINFEMDAEEITASYDETVPWADFHIAEANVYTPITVDEHGRVFGHLAKWGQCHEGIDGRCVLAPKPKNYAEYNQPGVLTDRGMVETGPIFFLGGHPRKPLGADDRWAAYGGIENAWADVRVVNGQLGPWISGRVRPGITSEALYMAHASRISGHWRTNNSLAAIVSCNVAAYNIPGSGLRADRDGARIVDGKVVELVASLHEPAPEPEPKMSREGLLAFVKANYPTSVVWGVNPTTATPYPAYVTSGNVQLTVAPDSEIPGTIEETIIEAIDDALSSEDAERMAMLVEVEIELDA